MSLAVGRDTALLLVDLQNDFLAPDGAYARAGIVTPELTALPARLAPVLDAARAASVPVISAQFTLLAVRGRQPLISGDLSARRPFLGTGDFEAGTRGHALVAALAPADVIVSKIAYSAFHGSPLEHVLTALSIRTLIVAGILTNGGVTSTVRAAHVLGYGTWVVSDGCADLKPEIHEAALRLLGAGISGLVDCAETTAALSAYAERSAEVSPRTLQVTVPRTRGQTTI